MALITPATSLPAQSVSPSGTLTTSYPQGILTATLSNGGAAVLRLISQNEGGYWYYTGDVLSVNSSVSPSDATQSIYFTNPAQSQKYFVVADGGSATVVCYLSSLIAPGASTTLVAHASSHLAGGSDDLLGAPGTVGGTTPGIFCGTFGPDSTHQNTVPTVNGGTFDLLGTAQTFSAVKTFSAAPVFAAGVTASGAVSFDLSGSTATQKSTTGAQTIGGGAAAIGITSSGAAITITAGAASTWKTTAGALTVDGNGGVNLQVADATIFDIGVTSATKVSLAANIDLNGVAGTGAVSLGSMTGNTALPTGNLSWAAAATKTLSLAAAGAATVSSSGGALTLTGAAASTWSTSAGALNLSGFSGINLKVNGTTVADVGATTAANLTMAANKTIAMAAGTGGISAGSATGDTALPTGAFSWSGGTTKALTLAATAASSITSSAGLTITPATASTWSTTAGALTLSGGGGINLQYSGTTVADVGVTATTAVTLAANKSLIGAAGTGAMTLGNMTGDMTLPTGALSWAGASGKSLSLVTTGAGTVTIDNASTWSLGATAGTSGTIGRTGQSVTFPGTVTNSTTLTQTGIATFNAAPAFAAGLTASGAVANDFSAATGTFLTSTGLNTIGGDLLMASGKVVGFGAPGARSGAGAVDVTTLVTEYTSTGGAQALTLANGTRAGQLKVVVHAVDGGSGVITPATPSGFATATLTNLYDCVVMLWNGSAWKAVLATGAAAFA